MNRRDTLRQIERAVEKLRTGRRSADAISAEVGDDGRRNYPRALGYLEGSVGAALTILDSLARDFAPVDVPACDECGEDCERCAAEARTSPPYDAGDAASDRVDDDLDSCVVRDWTEGRP